MESLQTVFGTLIEIPNAEVTLVEQDKSTVVDHGVLKLTQNKETGFMVIIVNGFRYTISREIPIIATYDKGYPVYTVPDVEGSKFCIAVKGPSEQDLLDALEMYFLSAGDFKRPGGRRGAQPAVEATPGGELTPEPQPETKTDKVKTYIATGGEKVKEGLISVATFISKGIEGVGEYVTGQVDHQEEVKVNAVLKTGVQGGKTATSAALTYAKTSVQGLVKTGEGVARSLSEKWDQSETGQKLEANEEFQTAKTIGKSAIYAVTNLYEGIMEAGAIIGTSVGVVASNIIEKKYGREAGEVSRDAIDAAGNVFDATRILKTEVVTHVRKQTDPKMQRPENLNLA